MTSANVTEYRIERNGEVVGSHYHSHLCHPKWHRLWKFTPWSEHTIAAHWLDEEETRHEGEPESLANFIMARKPTISDIKRLIKHIEDQRKLLNEWSTYYGSPCPDLDAKTRRIILHNPL